MKREKIYNWDTSHDTVDKLMTHHFVKGIELVVDWGNMEMAFFHNSRLIGRLPFPEGYTMTDHTDVTMRTSVIANARAPFDWFRRLRLKMLCRELRSL